MKQNVGQGTLDTEKLPSTNSSKSLIEKYESDVYLLNANTKKKQHKYYDWRCWFRKFIICATGENH